MEETEINKIVEERVAEKWDEKEIGHIKRQAMKLSIILGILGLLLLILGAMWIVNGVGIAGIIIGFLAVVYIGLAILLFVQRTKTMMLIVGVICLLFGLFTGLLPIFIGIALIYYFYKYDKILNKQESQVP